MILNVVKAKYIDKYTIQLVFNTNETKKVDLKDTIFNDPRKIFEPLKNINYFKNFEIKLNTITWSNQLDLAPEYLYKLKSI